ncbi:MAG: endolytic transglycosylase MltG [Bacilli bacterium]
MKKYCTIYLAIIIVLVIFITTLCCTYNYSLKPVSKESKEITIEIKEESTYLSIASLLKENNLIKSEAFYKVYVKIFKPNNLQAGTYLLDQNMGVKKIIKKLEENKASIDTVKLVIPEGKHIEDVAISVAKITSFKKEALLEYWNSEELLDKVIKKYWFITKDVKNDKIRYNLEGYFFPATYEILKDNATKEDITFKMLDKMDEVLTKYKKEIENSKYSVHEILTLASIVEHEAILDEDRPMIAKVFLNRLDKDMMLQSCATIGYAINNWKLTYTNSDLKTDSPYNTYLYYGLPIGPGGLAGKKSIEAVLNPDDNDYLYFLADVYNENATKTYYSKTYGEHQQQCLEYLGKSC